MTRTANVVSILRKKSSTKGLLWEGDGFLLLTKRFENGKYRWPRNEYEALELSEQQVCWLLEGLGIEQKKAIKPGKHGVLY